MKIPTSLKLDIWFLVISNGDLLINTLQILFAEYCVLRYNLGLIDSW